MLLGFFAKLLGYLALGFGLHRTTSPAVFKSLNRFILGVSLPAAMLLTLHGLKFDPTLLFPISMAWIVFAVALILFTGFGKRLGFNRQTTGALVLTAGLGNTSFIGYPLLTALYGEGALKTAILTDQPGSFLVLATLGVMSASYFGVNARSGGTLRAVCLRIAKFPPIWALVLSLALRPVAFADKLVVALKFLSQTLIPLALISVGSQLEIKKSHFKGREKALALGLTYKLALAPIFIFALSLFFRSVPRDVTRITILEAAMAPMITGAIIAKENGLDPELCALMVSIGIPISLLSVPFLSLF